MIQSARDKPAPRHSISSSDCFARLSASRNSLFRLQPKLQVRGGRLPIVFPKFPRPNPRTAGVKSSRDPEATNLCLCTHQRPRRQDRLHDETTRPRIHHTDCAQREQRDGLYGIAQFRRVFHIIRRQWPDQ